MVAAAAAAASDGMALPTVFEQAAAGVGVGGEGVDVAQVCIVRDGETARMGGCEEQTRLTLQVREVEHVKLIVLTYKNKGRTEHCNNDLTIWGSEKTLWNFETIEPIEFALFLLFVDVFTHRPSSVCERERYGGYGSARGAVDHSCERRRQERSQKVVGSGR